MRFIALVVEACFVEGRDSGSRDFKVIEVIAKDTDEVVDKIYNQRVIRYKNCKGQRVEWRLVDIFQFGRITSRPRDMEELAGFIAKRDELYGRPSKIMPKNRYLKAWRRDLIEKV